MLWFCSFKVGNESAWEAHRAPRRVAWLHGRVAWPRCTGRVAQAALHGCMAALHCKALHGRVALSEITCSKYICEYLWDYFARQLKPSLNKQFISKGCYIIYNYEFLSVYQHNAFKKPKNQLGTDAKYSRDIFSYILDVFLRKSRGKHVQNNSKQPLLGVHQS